jgi:hypothetical protein
VLVAMFAVDDQAAYPVAGVHLDADVLVDVNTRELDAYDRVVAILDDLGFGVETAARRGVPSRRSGASEKVAQPPVGAPGRSRPDCEVTHGASLLLP